MRPWSAALVSSAAIFLSAFPVPGDEHLAGIACRSVHLHYPAGVGVAFHNEVTVEHSAPGTYFCVCGWNKGYFGIQELGNGKKVILFSVWDSSQNDPRAVEEDRRVKVLHKDDKVRIGRFFQRDRVSTTRARQARFGNAWVKTARGSWEPLTRATFTADRNPATNINAGVRGQRFFLATGGQTNNADTKLNESMALPPGDNRAGPTGLPKLD
jgi:hypothetical protein